MSGFLNMILLGLFLLFGKESFSQLVVYDNFDDFEKEWLLERDAEMTYVINFWATWCVPCVKELPYFESLNEQYAKDNVKVVLVSLDFKENLNSRLLPFIEEKGLKSEVILLADDHTNDWIDKVDTSWSGAIPITLFLKGEKRLFVEKQYHSLKELEEDYLSIHQ